VGRWNVTKVYECCQKTHFPGMAPGSPNSPQNVSHQTSFGSHFGIQTYKNATKNKDQKTIKIWTPTKHEILERCCQTGLSPAQNPKFFGLFLAGWLQDGTPDPKMGKNRHKIAKNSPKGLLENDIVTNISDHKSTSLAQLPVACTSRFPVVSPLA
jgi:hypothetical protein